MPNFEEAFQKITGNWPYPWQARLYEKFSRGVFPDALDIPTGLGKTSVMTVWLLALAARMDHAIHIPTRLVYLVDRRAIVDQASAEALQIRSKIAATGGTVRRLNVSSLRGGGGSADGREWLREPHVPSIIVGTIDMIGSRLLFSGYGVGRSARPFYAGMLGQDSLIILDETHLSPAMEKVLLDVRRIAESAKHALLPPKVMLMSATRRSGRPADAFTLDGEDKKHKEIWKRYESEKRLSLVEAPDVVRRVTDEALGMDGRVLVYLQKPRDVQRVSSRLRKLGERVVTLTGTMRGFERDQLTQNDDYVKFGQHERPDGRCFLVSTSAGEVGVDLDADNMVCDIATLDSIMQRLGRVNRSGGRPSRIVVAYSKQQTARKGIMREPLENTLNILRDITGETRNANPAALEGIDHDAKMSAFSPAPETQPLTQDILDTWSMTSIYRGYASRPSVQYWLRGKPKAQAPETYVVWRDDVALLAKLGSNKVLEVLDKYRILPHEVARGPSADVHRMLQTMDCMVAVVRPDGSCSIKEAPEIGRNDIWYATVLLPCAAGGLGDDGILRGAKRVVSDVADEESRAILPHDARNADGDNASGNGDGPSGARRARIVVSSDGDGQYRVTKTIKNGGLRDANMALDEWLDERPQMALAYSADLRAPRDEDYGTEEIRYYTRAPERQGSVSLKKQGLDDHHADVEEAARRIVDSLGVLEPDIADAVVTAARMHDEGKARERWQRCMRVPEADRPLAKTGRRIRPLHMGGFRHELASVVDAGSVAYISEHPERDLILHLVAAHHGWARPCFGHDALTEDDPEDELYRTMTRYARLQDRFGAWGLAWLEGLLRGADWASSAALDRGRMQR